MGKLFWILLAVGLALPIMAGFAFIPTNAEPQIVGDYFNGVIQYWSKVMSEIRWPF